MAVADAAPESGAPRVETDASPSAQEPGLALDAPRVETDASPAAAEPGLALDASRVQTDALRSEPDAA